MCREHLKSTSPSDHEDGLVLDFNSILFLRLGTKLLQLIEGVHNNTLLKIDTDKIMASRFMILGENAIGQI